MNPGSAWGVVLAVFVILAVLVSIRNVRMRSLMRADARQAYLEERDWAMYRHDEAAQALSPNSFARHQQFCSRCAGDEHDRYRVSSEALYERRP